MNNLNAVIVLFKNISILYLKQLATDTDQNPGIQLTFFETSKSHICNYHLQSYLKAFK